MICCKGENRIIASPHLGVYFAREMRNLESLLLHCPYSYFIWNKVCAKFGFSWALPKNGVSLIRLEINSYRDKSKSRELLSRVQVVPFGYYGWRGIVEFSKEEEEKEWL